MKTVRLIFSSEETVSPVAASDEAVSPAAVSEAVVSPAAVSEEAAPSAGRSTDVPVLLFPPQAVSAMERPIVIASRAASFFFIPRPISVLH